MLQFAESSGSSFPGPNRHDALRISQQEPNSSVITKTGHPYIKNIRSILVSYTAEIELRPIIGGEIKRKYDEETGTFQSRPMRVREVTRTPDLPLRRKSFNKKTWKGGAFQAFIFICTHFCTHFFVTVGLEAF